MVQEQSLQGQGVRVLVYDTEADGLLDAATTIHCAVTKMDGVVTQYTPVDITRFISDLSNLGDDTVIVCHNQLGYDLRLMEKLYGYRHRGVVLDTLVMSRLLNPERLGRHGLESWGERLGRSKPSHEDWSRFTPAMLHRCKEDTEINYLVYKALMKEGGLNEYDLLQLPSY